MNRSREKTHTHINTEARIQAGESLEEKKGEPWAPAGIQLLGTRMAPPGASGPAPPQAGLSGSSLPHRQGPAGSL